MKLSDFETCMQGIYPASFYTCSKEGIPNVGFLSQVHYLDEQHVAISGQFLNKTQKNLNENPYASVILMNPVDMCHIELDLKWKRSEDSGPIFDVVAERIEAIDSQVRGHGMFKLRTVEIFEVLKVDVQDEFKHYLSAHKKVEPFSLQNLQKAIQNIQTATSLEDLYEKILSSLEIGFGFKHSVLLIPDRDKLVAIHNRGYEQSGVGAEVKIGEGIIGKVAESKRPLAFMGLRREVLYAQTSLSDFKNIDKETFYSQAISLPRLGNALSQMAVPLISRGELKGVLCVEAMHLFEFKASDEEFVMTFGNFVAMAMENYQLQLESDFTMEPEKSPAPVASSTEHHIAYYVQDECIFIDGEYLIRNIPAKLFWKITNAFVSKGQEEFSNRELRLDPFLQLPDFKDNLETRIILLRKRLEKKCPNIKLVPAGRGKFKLVVAGKFRLEEI